jgi:hypothetical protein
LRRTAAGATAGALAAEFLTVTAAPANIIFVRGVNAALINPADFIV